MEKYLSNPENKKAYEEYENSIKCKVHHALILERIKNRITSALGLKLMVV